MTGVVTDEVTERAADREWLALDVDDAGTRGSLQLADLHVTHLGHLYGGAGLALVGAMVEAATGRRLRWATAQFVRQVHHGDPVDLVAEVLADGRRSSQVRVTAWHAGEVVLAGLGAAGAARDGIPDAVLPTAPVARPVEDCPVMAMPLPEGQALGFLGLCEFRDANVGEPKPHFWMRFPGRPGTRPVVLPMLADVIPGMVMQAIGVVGAGNSLDNTIRVGVAPDSEWVLVEGVPEQAADGYGHGFARLWAPDGSLAGSGSQTATLWRPRG
jgi:acyl-CoA thioesterase